MKSVWGRQGYNHSWSNKIKGGHVRSLQNFERFWRYKWDDIFLEKGGNTRGHDVTLFKKRVILDVGKFCFGNRVCDEWNRLPEGVVNIEGVNKFKGNFDHYLKENTGFKYVMLTLSSLESFALSNLLIATVLGKLCKYCVANELCRVHTVPFQNRFALEVLYCKHVNYMPNTFLNIIIISSNKEK